MFSTCRLTCHTRTTYPFVFVLIGDQLYSLVLAACIRTLRFMPKPAISQQLHHSQIFCYIYDFVFEFRILITIDPLPHYMLRKSRVAADGSY